MQSSIRNKDGIQIRLQLHPQHLVHPQRLSYTQVQHDLFAPAGNCISSHISIKPFNLGALSSPRITQASKDLASLPSTEFKGRRRLRLQSSNRATKLQHRFRLIHALALEHHVLEPVIRRLNLAGHVGKLEANDGVLDELLAERAPLVSVLDRLLVAHAGEAETLDNDADALVVEIGHDDAEPLVFLADEVLDGDLDVFEGDVGGAGGPDALAVYFAGGDAAEAALDEEERDAVHAFAAGADRGGEVLAPDAIGDPFLLSVHDVVFAVFAELGFACDVGDVASGIL